MMRCAIQHTQVQKWVHYTEHEENNSELKMKMGVLWLLAETMLICLAKSALCELISWIEKGNCHRDVLLHAANILCHQSSHQIERNPVGRSTIIIIIIAVMNLISSQRIRLQNECCDFVFRFCFVFFFLFQ